MTIISSKPYFLLQWIRTRFAQVACSDAAHG
jgi:hypothetical protein